MELQQCRNRKDNAIQCQTTTTQKQSRSQSLRSSWPVVKKRDSGSNHFEITKEKKTNSAHPVSLRSLHLCACYLCACSQSLVFWPLVKENEDSGNEMAQKLKITSPVRRRGIHIMYLRNTILPLLFPFGIQSGSSQIIKQMHSLSFFPITKIITNGYFNYYENVLASKGHFDCVM